MLGHSHRCQASPMNESMNKTKTCFGDHDRCVVGRRWLNRKVYCEHGGVSGVSGTGGDVGVAFWSGMTSIMFWELGKEHVFGFHETGGC